MSARLSAKRYVSGGTTRVFKKLGYIMLAVILPPCFSPDDRVIERSDIKRLAWSPSSFHNNRTYIRYSKRTGNVDPSSVVFLSLVGGGGGGGGWGWGGNVTGPKYLHTASVTM